MTDYNINLLHTVIHKFWGTQINLGRGIQAFRQEEPLPDESGVDISIRSTLSDSLQGRYLQTHFQVDDVRLPEDEEHFGYRLQLCLLAVFSVDEPESVAKVKEFVQTRLPNILAPIISDNHYRFVATLQPGVSTPKLPQHIPLDTINTFVEQGLITFKVAEPLSQNQ